METQEIPEAQEPQKSQEPQKTQEPTEGSKTAGPKTEGQQKMKNPVRVAAGKKGAEARWSKRNQAQAQQAQPEHEPIRITKESPEQPPPRFPVILNVYKNFFPLCVLIGAAGIGIFLICRKAEMQPKMQPEIQPEIKQRPTDPFEMR